MKDQSVDIKFGAIKGDSTDSQKKWFNRKLMRLAYAGGLIGNQEIMTKVPPIEFSQLKGRQVVMELAYETDKDGNRKIGNDGNPTTFLVMAWSNVWHVDDPAIPKSAIKNTALINLLPANLRRTPEYFAELRKFEEAKKAGVAGGGANSSTNKPTPPANNNTAPAANVSVGDLV